MNRRGFLAGIIAAAAAPAIIRTAGLIMPIKPRLVPSQLVLTSKMVLRTASGAHLPIDVDLKTGSIVEAMARACSATIDLKGACFIGENADIQRLQIEVIRDRNVLWGTNLPGWPVTIFRGLPVVEREQFYRSMLADRAANPPLLLA